MKKIGITGGIATGKSTFLKILKNMGFPVFSCDEVVNTLYNKSFIKEQLIKLFGRKILKGSQINRKKILKEILKNPELKKKLENIFHPEVKKNLFEFFQNNTGKEIVFAEVPLLFEAGWDKFFDEIWVITCSLPTQKKRLKDRGFSEELISKLISLQIPLCEKEKKAHKIFSSEKSIKELEKELKLILKEYL